MPSQHNAILSISRQPTTKSALYFEHNAFEDIIADEKIPFMVDSPDQTIVSRASGLPSNSNYLQFELLMSWSTLKC